MYITTQPNRNGIQKQPGLQAARIGILFVMLFSCTLMSEARPPLFGKIEIEKSNYDKEAHDSIARVNALRLDSLLNTIQVDSVTQNTYALFPPYYSRPRVLGSFRDVKSQYIEIPPVDYTELAGTIEDADSLITIAYPTKLDGFAGDPIPDWFKILLRQENLINDANYRMMVLKPSSIEYANWDLPSPPRLPEEDFSFHAFLQRLNLPKPNPEDVILPETEQKKKHWLHFFNVGLQLSEAYVSSNWYQGGNSYLAGLFNFNWKVDLNQVYHPKLLFQSAFEYKLAVNSNPKGSLHKYNTSQDLLQYSLKTGLKAFNDHWYYSLNLLFQTQLFNSYPDDSMQRSSSLLSPGMLNIGIGMTYNLEALKKRLKLSASISPLAYNLKTCIFSDIDREQFGMQPGQKALSEIGSSAEINMTWNFTDNISWKSRLFLFTDYHYFLGDWENTFNFQLNRFLSTQLFLHPRFDSSTEASSSKWRHWMFRQILSFGISYTFSTKP